MKTLILILAICITSTNALAQGSKQKTNNPKPATHTSQQRLWDAEPESILSIKLGAPLSASMDECPKMEYGLYAFYSEKMCWQGESSDYYTVQNAPNLGGCESIIAPNTL